MKPLVAGSSPVNLPKNNMTASKLLKLNIKNEPKGGVTMARLSKAVDIIRGYDWMLNNPDTELVADEAVRQVNEEGLLRLSVFVCPKFNTDALQTNKPEDYMPERIAVDLFEPRIPKIVQLRDELRKAGVQTELNALIGDNDAEAYIFPFCPWIRFDGEIMKKRKREYVRNFERRLQKTVGKGCVVWSLGDLGVVPDAMEPSINQEQLEKERKFFFWLYSSEGPYKGKLSFPPSDIDRMIRLKFKLYGSQGKFLEELGGILLQTEGPGVWLVRTKMLRCTGSPAIPTIYPWIREEELSSLE